MDCIAPVERLRVLYCATLELLTLWYGKREECGPPEGCQAAANVLKDAMHGWMLGRSKVNKFNTNFRDDTSKSAWSDCISQHPASLH